MADQDTDQSEKTEQASSYKLEQARKRGAVVKSAELNHFLGMLVGLIFVIALGYAFIQQTLMLCARIFKQAGHLSFDTVHLMSVGSGWLIEALTIMSPLVGSILIVGVISNMIQTGPVFSFHPMKPDFNRLNPIAGFKKFMSIKLVFELVKTLVKFSLFSAVAYVALKNIAAEMFTLYQQSVYAILPFFLSQAVNIMMRLIIVMAIFAIIDRLFVRWEYLRQMRMTRKEMMDEIKRREGDPMIRRRRKEIEHELRKKSQSMGRVEEGDVVITNPTHYAVVLKYDRATMLAPIVIAKGAEKTAQEIKQRAYSAHIPVIRQPLLARRLYKEVNIDGPIPVDAFIAVAKVFNQAFQMKKDLPQSL